jgi:hypothetical protein
MRVVRILAALGALTIAAPPVGATTFTPGEFFTYDQFEYGTNTRLEEPNNPQAAALLEDNFDTVYAPFEDLLQVGVPGPAGVFGARIFAGQWNPRTSHGRSTRSA